MGPWKGCPTWGVSCTGPASLAQGGEASTGRTDRQCPGQGSNPEAMTTHPHLPGPHSPRLGHRRGWQKLGGGHMCAPTSVASKGPDGALAVPCAFCARSRGEARGGHGAGDGHAVCADEERAADHATDAVQPLPEDQRQAGRCEQHPAAPGQVRPALRPGRALTARCPSGAATCSREAVECVRRWYGCAERTWSLVDLTVGVGSGTRGGLAHSVPWSEGGPVDGAQAVGWMRPSPCQQFCVCSAPAMGRDQ